LVRKFIFFSILILSGVCTKAQSVDSLNRKKKDSTLLQTNLLSDTSFVSTLELIDSLLATPPLLETGSSFIARLGYNSNVNSTSQALGLNQFGISPGVTYFHKSGLYLDVTAYWSSEYLPNLYLTIPSAGYLKTVKKWTFNLEYSRYLYSPSDSSKANPYTNVISVSNFLKAKPFLFRLDYNLYFGDKTSHRITPAVMINLEKKNWLGIDRLWAYPTFNISWGNDILESSQYIPYYTRLADIIYAIRHNQKLYYQQTRSTNEFGIINYSISMPIGISIKNWVFLANYTYNFPQALPDEYGLNNSGYLTFSLSRYFNFKSKSAVKDFLYLPNRY